MNRLKGHKLGKYELVERLGKGGMAEVWKAFQPRLERFVAIKLMHKHLADEANFVERFRREARGIGQLQHNNIVRLIDFEFEGDEHYMVMDYIEGGTLQEYLSQNRILAPTEALRIVEQLADALAYAHQSRMVHRDIKPGNIMFTDDSCSSVVLTDFGVARVLNNGMTMTMTGAMLGTPAYMSPEALRSEKVDERADIYSLGVVLYEMLTGRTPYMADTPYKMIIKQLREPHPSPREINPDLPEVVEQLVLKALAKETNERYQNAYTFHEAIQETLAALSEINGKPSAVSSSVRSHRLLDSIKQQKANFEGAVRELPRPLEATNLVTHASFLQPAFSNPRRLAVIVITVLLVIIIFILALEFLLPPKRNWNNDNRGALTTITFLSSGNINAPTSSGFGMRI